jgi:hypothetical protein
MSLKKILLILGLLLVYLILLEFGFRALCETDADGNRYFRGVKLKAYKMPVKTIDNLIKQYEINKDKALYIFNSFTGWSPNPIYKDKGKIIIFNKQGIRSPASDYVYEINPKRRSIRIALFGDSFTQASGVPFQDSWGNILENTLRKEGFDVEVINFGVGGFGIDQIFLRWQTVGIHYKPDIVVFGFQPEDVERNVNILPILKGWQIPFSKPRFKLGIDSLKLFNYPVMPLNKVKEALNDIERWPLVGLELQYNPNDYKNTFISYNKLVSFLEAKVLNNRFIGFERNYKNSRHWLNLNTESAQITLWLVRNYKESVESAGGKFIIVHLPGRSDLKWMEKNGTIFYNHLISSLNIPVIRSENELIKEANKLGDRNKLFLIDGHYAPIANNIIAKLVSNNIREYLIKKDNGS